MAYDPLVITELVDKADRHGVNVEHLLEQAIDKSISDDVMWGRRPLPAGCTMHGDTHVADGRGGWIELPDSKAESEALIERLRSSG